MRVKSKIRVRHKKSGTWINKGDEFELITPTQQDPGKCLIVLDIDTQISFPTNSLGSIFYGFLKINDVVPFLKEAVEEGLCKTVKGNMVEPDGWDRQGFPSIILAEGMI